MTLSAAIIVKNEAQVIKRCMDCVLLWADEIVVVDTGSTDKTKELIAAYPGVKLLDSEHYNAETHFSDFSFSIAKNEAIRACTGDWVCFPRGNPVFTERGLVDISAVNAGDKVLSHDGALRLVTDVGSREYNGELVRLRCRGNGVPIECTPEHPFLVVRPYRCHLKKGATCLPNCRKQYKRLRSGKKTRNCCQPYMQYTRRWVKASEIERGDILLFPIYEPEATVSLESIGFPRCERGVVSVEEIGRLVGLYLAEGCPDWSRGAANFAFHRRETELHQFVVSVCTRLGFSSEVRFGKRDNGATVRVAGVDLVRFLTSNFGEASHEKRLPFWVYQMGSNFMWAVAGGWVQGDGGERKDGLQAKTVSVSLAYGMRQLFAMLGVETSFTSYSIESGMAFNFVVGGAALTEEVMSRLGVYSRFVQARSKTYQLSCLNGRYLYMPVTRVARRQFSGRVYNLEVEKDNSYVCSGVAAHNCWWDADDFIDADNAAKIREIVRAEPRDRLFSFTVTFGSLTFEHCRMFPSGLGILFDENHSCHEYLNPCGHQTVLRREVVIQHKPGVKAVTSSARNMAILEKDYMAGRDDPRTLFYLASAYRENGHLEAAVEHYDKYLAVSQWREERHFARLYKAQTLVGQRRWSEAREEALRSMAEDFRFAEPCCVLGDLAFRDGDIDRAELWFRMALATPLPTNVKLFLNRVMHSEYPVKRLEDCIAARGAPASMSAETNKDRTVVAFELPKDRTEAIAALGGVAMFADARPELEVKVRAESWMHGLIEVLPGLGCVNGETDVRRLERPVRLGKRHIVEWYCRSAGYVPDSVRLFSLPVTRKPSGRLVICCPGDGWGNGNWGQVVDVLRKRNIGVVCIGSEQDAGEILDELSRAAVVLCEEGWVQHVACAADVPAIVLWNEGKPDLEGWSKNRNLAIADVTPEAVAGAAMEAANAS